MRLNRLLIAGFAALVLSAACNDKPQDLGDPELTVTPAEVNFETSEVAEQSVTVFATRDWKVSDPEAVTWISVSPASGSGSNNEQKVTISVLENTENDRSADLTFTIGLKKVTVRVIQKGAKGEATTGDGTVESPYTAGGALAFIETLGADVNSEELYVKGVVNSFKGDPATDISKYGSISYYIGDAAGATLYIYGCKNLGNQKFTSADQLVVGDEVVVKGKLVNYKGNTPEMTQGCYIVSRNGEGEGGGETPEIPEITKMLTTADILAMAEGATFEEGAGVEGIIVSNKDLNNLTSMKAAYLQDDKGAIQLRFDSNHSFAFGEKVKINLEGAKKGAYNKAVQVEVKLANAASVSKGNSVTPKTVSVADFLANKYEGQYIAIENCQVAASDLANTFVMNDSHTSINMETMDGSRFLVFSSKYSTFKAETVPAGSGTLKGISSRNNDDIQIIFARSSDYSGLTGARFGGPAFIVSPTALNVGATATSAEINVTAGVPWTAVSGTEGFTVSPASGNGNGTITVSFAANETESARTATVKVSTTSADVTTKEYTVTITQAAKAAEGEGVAITWTLGANAYDITSPQSTSQHATVNGQERTDILKLGKSGAGGDATLHIPAGTKAIRYYALGWKGKSANATIKMGDQTLGTFALKSNDGASGNPPYTITVSDEDYMTFDVPGGALTTAVDVVLSTDKERGIFFGIAAIK